ncbi:hypothetical protein [Arthrobacter sp. JSM 101049]|uniref:nucleotide-binding protein n=1 Tax=Arthrobacter sp. JSM 101049 TaxID=929097 RepID=UPI0035690E33
MNTSPQPHTPAHGQQLDPWGQPVDDPWAPPPTDRRPRRGRRPELDQVQTLTEAAPGPPSSGVGSPLEIDRRRLARVRATGGFLTRTLGSLFGGTHPATTVGRHAAEVQAPVTTGRRIAVVSTRGGAGKTTAATLLARVYSTLRPDNICVLDLDPGHGSLALRLGIDGAPAFDEVIPGIIGGAQPGTAHLVEMLGAAAPNLFATGPRAASAGGGRMPDLREAAATVSRYFPLTVLDCPTGVEAPETQAALADCHGALFVVPATLSGMDDALAALAGWRQHPFLAGLPLMVLVMQQDHSSALQALDQAGRLSRLGFDAHAIGYDRHLAAGARLALPQMLPAHREAATTLAARVLGLANGAR